MGTYKRVSCAGVYKREKEVMSVGACVGMGVYVGVWVGAKGNKYLIDIILTG